MPYKPREIADKLRNKFDFKADESKGDDHWYYILKIEGVPPIRTKFSHNKKEIGSKLEGMICRQLRIKKPFLDGMIKCTNSKEAYYKQLRESPFPAFEEYLKK